MRNKEPKKTTQDRPDVARRKFLNAATAATTGVAIAGVPMIARGIVKAARPPTIENAMR